MATQISRRRFVGHVAGAMCLGMSAFKTHAQTVDLIRLVCGYPAGGSVDFVGRKLAQQMSGHYAHTIIVDNRPGAAGRVAVDVVKKAAPDGSTLLLTPASVLTMYPHIYRQLPYDVFADLTPVSIAAVTAFALAVGPTVPDTVTSLVQFLDWCKANPAMAQFGNPGAGSIPHFLALMLARETGVDLIHVPYRGGAMAFQDVAAGHIAAAISTEGSAEALSRAGKLRVLATSWKDRSPFFPNVPTFAGLRYPALSRREWYGIFMPARTPPLIATTVADAVGTALQVSSTTEAFGTMGLVAEASRPSDLQASLRSEYEFWGPVIKASGFTPES